MPSLLDPATSRAQPPAWAVVLAVLQAVFLGLSFTLLFVA
jgi:hypothetical protein